MSKGSKSLMTLPQATGYSVRPVVEQTSTAIDKRQYINETPRLMETIDGQWDLGGYAIDRINELRIYATAKFSETAESIVNIRDRARGTGHEQYVAEFSHFMIESAAQDTAAVARGTAIGIAREAMSPPITLVPEKPKPKGLLARIFAEE